MESQEALSHEQLSIACAAGTSNRDFLGKPGSHKSKMLLKEGVGAVWVEG